MARGPPAPLQGAALLRTRSGGSRCSPPAIIRRPFGANGCLRQPHLRLFPRPLHGAAMVRLWVRGFALLTPGYSPLLLQDRTGWVPPDPWRRPDKEVSPRSLADQVLWVQPLQVLRQEAAVAADQLAIEQDLAAAVFGALDHHQVPV